MIHLQTFFDKKWQSNDPMETTNNKNNRTKKYYSYQHNKSIKKN